MSELKAKELRIGNLVDIGGNGIESIVIVQEITASGITYDSLDGSLVAEHCEWKNVKFIDLSESWLTKFGFSKSNLYGYREHFIYTKHTKVGTIQLTALYNADFSMIVCGIAKGIAYVHRIQNLHLDLTHEELTITH